MLDDFASNYIEHAKEEYFLGSYIIQSKDNNNDLLDGQQRITTLFLFLRFCVTMPILLAMSRKPVLI